MKLADLETLVQELFTEHKLEWNFKLDSAKVRFGQCNHRTKTISMSRTLVLANDIEQVRNTLLHEIAHALVGRGFGHGWVWKQKARSIGCNAQPRYGQEVVSAPGAWVGTCSTCNTVRTRHRAPRKRVACGACCIRYNSRRFSEDYLINWTRL